MKTITSTKQSRLTIKVQSLSTWAYLKKEWLVYTMISPVILYYFIFHYIPMFGIVVAFQNYMPLRGFWNSPWVGFGNFQLLFHSADFWRILKNTFLISIYRLFFGFPAPILLALLINEVRNLRYKKIVQTISYLPHFLSWVIVGGLITTMLSLNGPVNSLTSLFGVEPTQWILEPSLFRSMLVGSGIWKEIGWGTLIYLAAISGVDSDLYEAAVIDGAGRLRQVWHVTLPSIRGTIIILFILSVGGILDAGFEQVFLLQTPMTVGVSEIIDTYVYKVGLQRANFSFASAIGIFKSLVGMCMIIFVNYLAKKAGQDSMW